MSEPGANPTSAASAATTSTRPASLAPPSTAFDRLEALAPPSSRFAHGTADDGAAGRPVNGTAPTTTATAATPAAPRLTRRGRVRKWDRPKQPMDWRFWVGGLGKILIAVGLLMFGFVAYQLWGTGIETARAQNTLENEFDALLAETPAVEIPAITPNNDTDDTATAPVTTIPPADAGDETDPDDPADNIVPVATVAPVPVEKQNLPPGLQNGQALARLVIPRINRSDIVVAGVDKGDLKRGPGHFPDTPLPGQLGNAAIAGHRTTYGAPFFDIDDMQIGDEIIAETLSGKFTYRVTGQQIVSSTEYWVVATQDPNRATLTLVSCHPKYTAQQRIVIFSELVSSESSPVGEPIINYGRPEEPTPDVIDLPPDETSEGAGELPGDLDDTSVGGEPEAQTTPAAGSVTGNLGDVTVVDEQNELTAGQVSDEVVDAFSGGWFSDTNANNQVGMWGALLGLVGLGAYFVSRRLRRDWAGALIGIIPFVVTLYFFFQNVNRLLPANL